MWTHLLGHVKAVSFEQGPLEDSRCIASIVAAGAYVMQMLWC